MSERSPADQLLCLWSNDRIRDSRCQGDAAAFDDALRHADARQRPSMPVRQRRAGSVQRG
ncbi:hypothetical protein WJ03_20370 [Burkholderia vietnamiensis]|nr:hypothetical protein WJ03_20370 [Burkholderia vietnamiensis]